MRGAERLGWAGPAAAALFAASLLGFAAIRTDGYSHATKAVSELGAVGAPNALAFNLLGFVLPGLLVAALAGGLRAALKSSAGPLLLGLSGLFFLGAGVFPVDMTATGSALSVTHLAMAQLSGLAFAIAVFPLGSAMRRHPHFAALGRVTPWFLLFLLTNVAWQVVWQATGSILPGWGQRIAFGGYFVWTALAGYRLTRLDRA
ncbi:MAG TPA: DUF998 domain-containing protein [Allosphingosinicella sp.]|nr:DUF998 domain-containing protein [Allosphingosinicella sp.]